MSQFSIVQAIALTRASFDKLLDNLGLSIPIPSLTRECISLPALQDQLRHSAICAHTSSLTRYHSHLEQHQMNLTQTQRMEALSAAETLARADATLEALRADPSISMVAQHLEYDELQPSVDSLMKARKDYLNGEHSSALQKANSSTRKITTTLHSAYNRLAEAHRTVLSESVSESLSDMGYTIDMAAEGNRLACWGHKWGNGMFGHGLLSETSIAVVIQEDGRLAMDMSGFQGGECEMEMHRLFEGLRKRGIQVKREEVVPHLRKEGGQLISSANGRNAQGLLQADTRSASRISRPVNIRNSKRRIDQQDNDSRYRAAAAWLWMQQKG